MSMTTGRSFTLGAAALAFALCLTFQTAATRADDLGYGAIASEQGNDDAVGHATDFNTKEAAVAAAIAACNKYTNGKDDCTLRVWFHKQRCAAYVANEKETNYYFGDTKDDVIQQAHDDFPDGKVIDTACN